MRWRADGPCAHTREDGKYTMNRSPQEGWPATFMLVRNADSKIVSVMQAEDQLDYRARVKMMMSKCDA